MNKYSFSFSIKQKHVDLKILSYHLYFFSIDNIFLSIHFIHYISFSLNAILLLLVIFPNNCCSLYFLLIMFLHIRNNDFLWYELQLYSAFSIYLVKVLLMEQFCLCYVWLFLMKLSMKQKQIHRPREQTCSCQVGCRRGMDWKYGIYKCGLLYIE